MDVIKATLANFKYHLKDVLFFEMLYKLIAMIFFTLINEFIFGRHVLLTGQLHLSNKDIVHFSLSHMGTIGLVILILISFIGIFIELFVLMQFANRAHHKQDVNVFSDTFYTIKFIFQHFNLHFIFLFCLTGCIGGLFGVSLFNTFIRELRIPSLVMASSSTSLIGTLMLFSLFIMFVLFLMRWFLTIPIYLIEDVSLKSAMHRSVTLYKQQKLKVMSYLCGSMLFNFFFKTLLLVVYLMIGHVIFSLELLHFKYLMFLYLVLFIVGYLLLSLITVPLFLSFLTELYYTCVTPDVLQRKIPHPTPLKQPLTAKRYPIRLYVVLIFCIMICLSTSSLWFSIGKNTTQLTAHRGSSLKAPENTYASIAQAIEDGVEYAEIDAALTKDKQVVLFHDKTLKRVNGSQKKIKNLTLAELQTVDVGTPFHVAFKNEQIPSLEGILKLAKGKIKLNIELKTYGEDNELPLKVANLIKKYDMEREVIVSSMDYSAANAFKSYAPLVDVGYIITSDLHDLNSLNVDFVSIEFGYLSKELLYIMHALNKEVHVWTVNQIPKAKRATLLGVDNIITDNVDGVKVILKDTSHQPKDLIVMLYDGVSTIIRYLKL